MSALSLSVEDVVPASATTTLLTFQRDAAPASRLDAVAREFVADLADGESEAAALAAAAGLGPAELAGARVEIAETKQGLDPFVTPIVVGITVSAGSKVAETLWKEVLWPLIRRRLGKDALGRATAPPATAAAAPPEEG